MPVYARKIVMIATAAAVVLVGVVVQFPSAAKHAGEPAAAAAAPLRNALDLVDKGLSGPAGIEDEGAYKLIDPIGPGASTSVAAADEVYASTLVVGKYTPWQAYRDPFAAAPGTTPPPGPYSPSGPPRRRGGSL